MKKNILLFLLCVLLCIPFYSVKAETDEKTNGSSCNYKQINELNKLASNVKINQEVIDNGDGTYKFKFTIYNINENISIMINKTQEGVENIPRAVTQFDAGGGIYSFIDDNYKDLITYKFEIIGKKDDCTKTIKTITEIKPFYNKYYDYDDCKLESTQGSYYCQQWLKKKFELTESEILKKIQAAQQTIERITTTRCVDCDANTRKGAKKLYYEGIKRLATIGFSIGIVLDILFLYLKIDSIRRSSL